MQARQEAIDLLGEIFRHATGRIPKDLDKLVDKIIEAAAESNINHDNGQPLLIEEEVCAPVTSKKAKSAKPATE